MKGIQSPERLMEGLEHLSYEENLGELDGSAQRREGSKEQKYTIYLYNVFNAIQVILI